MAKIFYDKSLNIDIPTIILKKRDFTNIGNLIASEIKYKDNFASANELSFKVYKFIDEKSNSLWEEINDYNIIYVPEYEEFFDMQVSLSEEIGTYKVVTCTTLAESELSNINLYDIEINTEADMDRDDYDADYPTIFYRDLRGYEVGSETYKKLKGASLLHRILDKASNYEIGHVDTSLKNLSSWYEFSISNTNIYDELIGEIAEQYKCLFTFEIKEDGTRIVNAYDLCNTCNTCGYRGEFYDECPECHSSNFEGAYGKDTTIFSSKENLATSSTIESNKDQLKNCFRVSGGDDLITATIANLNPNGSNYFYYFSPEMLASMPEDLVSKIQEYNIMYDNYLENKEFVLSTANVNKYNNAVVYVKERYPDEPYSSITSKIIGYKNIATLDYNITDFLAFLEHSMMPTPDISLDGQTIEDAKNSLTTANLSPVAITNPSSSEAETISNNAVLAMAKILVNTALYKVEIDSSTYTYNSSTKKGMWNGVFKLTSFRDEKVTAKTDTVSITIDDDVERYVQQKIERTLAKEDDVIREITDIELPYVEKETDDGYEGSFLDRLTYYSFAYLQSVYQAFEACLGIIIESNNDDLKTNVYPEYQKRMTAVGKELDKRASQITDIKLLDAEIEKIKSETRNTLDFESYLGKDLWRIFCSYRREDSYQNDNFISDGDENDNVKLIERTQQLIDEAKKELYKAGNLQYNISSTLNNLLAIKEFQPLVEDFKCGNWIRVMIDEKIYSLRLLSYEIDYDNLENIGVEFSTVTKVWSGISDIQSILDSAQSVAGSYSSTVSKVNQATKSTKYVNNWVDKGFSLTANKIVNNADNQDIVIDKTGILCRSYDDIDESYDKYQAKIIGNGFYVTDDNWATVKGALGKYVYELNGKEEVAYGLLAETIVGKFIIGEQLHIQNSSGKLRFDTNGFTVTNDTNTFIINPNVSQLVKIQKNGTDIFYIDTNGNLNVTGKITATSGEFTGAIKSGSTITCGDYFKVLSDGTITAKKGTIANWTITGNRIESDKTSDGGHRSGMQSLGSDSTAAFYAGTTTSAGETIVGNSAFYVTQGGKLYSNNAEIEGKITADSGKIGAFTISETALYSKSSSINGSGTYLGKDGFSVATENAEEENTNALRVKVSKTGVLIQQMGGISDEANMPRITFKGAYGKADSTCSLVYYANNTLKWKGSMYIENNLAIQDLLNCSHIIAGNTLKLENYSTRIVLDSGAFRPGSINSTSSDSGTVTLGTDTWKWSTIYSTSSTISTSDANKKKDIYPINEKYENFYMDLEPIIYKFIDGTSGRTHSGFISQKVEQALINNNLTALDFAGFCKDVKKDMATDENGNEIEVDVIDENGNIEYNYSLRYEEFIALNTHMIQKIIKENKKLKETVLSLQERLDKMKG